MKTYWYLFPIVGFIWFVYDAFTWNESKIPPINDQDVWQYAYCFYIMLIHMPAIIGIGFLLIL